MEAESGKTLLGIKLQRPGKSRLKVRIDTQPNRSINLVASINSLLFIGLNILDVFITRWTLMKDGEEMFWWSASFNSNIMVKALLAMVIAFVLVRLGKERLLQLLNAGMVFVLLWNGVNLVSYLLGYYNVVNPL